MIIPDQVKNIFFESDLGIDQIIATFPGTVFVPAPTIGTSPVTVTTPIPHTFQDSTYFQGIFTTDGGITWNDFGSQTPNLSIPTQPVFQTIDCNATVDTANANIIMRNYYNFPSSIGVAYNVSFRIALIAKNTMAKPLNPMNIGSNVFFNSNYNYQKILTQGSIPINVPAGSFGSYPITYTALSVPNVRAWFFPSANPSLCTPLGDSYSAIHPRILTTGTTFDCDQTGGAAVGVSGTIEYRVYYD